jgi:hypothetical protein
VLNPALGELAKLLKDRKTPPAVRLRAIETVLERNGIGVDKDDLSTVVQVHEPRPVEIGPINTDNWTDEQLTKGQEFFRRLREAVARITDTPEGATGG